MLTNIRIHNLEKKAIKRSIDLAYVNGITKNCKEKETDEFVIHVRDEYDY